MKVIERRIRGEREVRVRVDLHQGSSLPLLEVMTHWRRQKVAPWCMLYADDVVPVGEN